MRAVLHSCNVLLFWLLIAVGWWLPFPRTLLRAKWTTAGSTWTHFRLDPLFWLFAAQNRINLCIFVIDHLPINPRLWQFPQAAVRTRFPWIFIESMHCHLPLSLTDWRRSSFEIQFFYPYTFIRIVSGMWIYIVWLSSIIYFSRAG